MIKAIQVVQHGGSDDKAAVGSSGSGSCSRSRSSGSGSGGSSIEGALVRNYHTICLLPLRILLGGVDHSVALPHLGTLTQSFRQVRNRLNWTARYSWYSRRSLAASTNNMGFLCISSLRFQLRRCRNLARRAWLSTQAGVGFDKWRTEYNLEKLKSRKVVDLQLFVFACVFRTFRCFSAFRLFGSSRCSARCRISTFRGCLRLLHQAAWLVG